MCNEVVLEIRTICEELADFLIEKNRKYGNSALEPVRIFSRADPIEQINVRLDDKLSRIRSAQADDDEDVEMDLLGYLILKEVARRLESRRVMDQIRAPVPPVAPPNTLHKTRIL